MQTKGVPASPSGSRASHEAASSTASSPEASIPNVLRALADLLDREGDAWALVAGFTLDGQDMKAPRDHAREAAYEYLLAEALRRRAGAIDSATISPETDDGR